MKVLMVCLGNICRSPLAEGILREKTNNLGLSVQVDSCGTANYHVDEHPDPRSISTASAHGIDISGLYGRQFSPSDFDSFDHILVMDESNYQNVIRLATKEEEVDKVIKILDYLSPNENNDVPDPYYGGEQGFERVYQLLDKASDAFLRTHFNDKK
jgi:protein-tyrosine phosphatase